MVSCWCPAGWVIAPAEGGQHSNVTYVALTDLKVRTESDAPLSCLPWAVKGIKLAMGASS